jgi:predicted transport protein
MSELRLFSISGGKAKECHPASYNLERELQDLFEANLEELLGVRYVASEFSTGQGGRIDTLGIDENGFPVVIEYKLDKNRTVINQGMAYMAWLRSHKAEFWKVVFEKLGKEVADSIDHSSTRLICIATDFTRDDLGAYELMPDNIDLVRYRRFGDDQLLLERITSSDTASAPSPVAPSAKTGTDRSISQWLEEAKPEIKSLCESLRQAILDQGEDVSEKATKRYFAFKRTRNFASILPRKDDLLLFLHLNPDSVEMKQNMRDVRNIGHWGTGDLEVRIGTLEDIQQALPLIQKAYEGQA